MGSSANARHRSSCISGRRSNSQQLRQLQLHGTPPGNQICFLQYSAKRKSLQGQRMFSGAGGIRSCEVIVCRFMWYSRGRRCGRLAGEYGVLPGLLARFNGLTEPYRLAVGQAILILRPESLYTVQPGGHGVFHCAEILAHAERALPAEPGVILAGAAVSGAGAGDEHRRPSNGKKTTLLGYAYPWANERTLRGILPYADTLVPFTYGFTEAGELVEPDDEGLLALAKEFGAKTLFASVDAHRAGKLFCPTGGRADWR